MSKKSKGKRSSIVDDAPIVPASAGRSFPCPRCQADLASAAHLPAHQLDVHAYGQVGSQT